MNASLSILSTESNRFGCFRRNVSNLWVVEPIPLPSAIIDKRGSKVRVRHIYLMCTQIQLVPYVHLTERNHASINARPLYVVFICSNTYSSPQRLHYLKLNVRHINIISYQSTRITYDMVHNYSSLMYIFDTALDI